MAPSTDPKEVKIRTPTEFQGDKEKATKFIREVELYLHVNTHIYNTDEKKSTFMLSFMTDGAAGAWKEAFIASKILPTGGFSLGNWTDFLKVFTEGFTFIDAAGNARLKLKTLKQGDRPVEEYISNFRIFASKSGITSNEEALGEYFMDGLQPRLLEKIYTMEKIPTKSENGLLLLPSLTANGAELWPSSERSEKRLQSIIRTTLLP
jgi:hypothetical protein